MRPSLANTPAPLTEDQAQHLVETWYAALPAAARGNPAPLTAEAAAGLTLDLQVPPLPAETLTLAEGIVSPAQVLGPFRRLVEIAEAQQRLQAIAAP